MIQEKITIDEASQRLASQFNQRLRDMVLLLRRAGAGLPVTAQQLAVLGSLEAGPRRMTELAAEHGVRLPTMTAQVARLARNGLVCRQHDPADARAVVVRLTPDGVRGLHAARAAREEFLAARFATLTVEERQLIAAALPALDKLLAR